MFKVINKTTVLLFECNTLDEAMSFAKSCNEFVTIKSPDFEVCGMFGVDTIKDGFTPDGVPYTWDKSNRIGRPKKETKESRDHDSDIFGE